MNDFFDSFAYWLADYYLATTVLLAASLVAMTFLKQPAKRIAVTKAALLSMVLLAALCALPGWSLVHFTTTEPPPRQPIANAPVSMAGQPPMAPTELLAFSPSSPDAAAFSAPAVAPPHAALPWLAIALALYSLGSAATLVWFGIGMIFARRLLRDSTPATGQVEDILTTVLAGESSRPRLRVSRQIDVAAALGIFRPTVLLPSSWATERSAFELRTVLAHECAHVRNGDLKWLAISRLASVVLWLQPLYWLIRRRMRLDQETLADAAAAVLSSRVTYAEQLVAWARAVPSRPRPALASAVGLWESPSQLRRRVAVLLDEHFPVLRECSRWLRWSSLLTCGFFAIALSAVTFQPTRSEPTEESRIPDRVVVGDRYVLCQVTTDLERSLLGNVAQPKADVSACLFVNLSAFGDAKFDARSPSIKELSALLAKWAENDNRSLLTRVYVGTVPNNTPNSEWQDREKTFAAEFEKLGSAAGYERVSSSWVHAGVFDWTKFVESAESLAKGAPSNSEQATGDDRVKIFAVQTFLSRLLINADCVVNILPTIEQAQAESFPGEFQNSLNQFVPRLRFDRREIILLRVCCTDSAGDRLEKWIDNRQAKEKFAAQFGFKSCNLEMSYVAEPDSSPPMDEITGQVVLPGGQPAVGVAVNAFSMSDPDKLFEPYGYQRGTTDEEGRFRLTIYSGGREVFWILPHDYVQQTHLINDRRGDLGKFTLATGLYFHGRVVDENSKPISNIWVNAELVDGPAKQHIEMPVADQIERSAMTDANGGFDLGPLPAGIYRVGPDEMPADDFRNLDESRRALPAAFLSQRLELKAASELEEIEIKPVDSVKIEVRFVDSQGHPTEGIGFFLIGTGPDGKRVAYRRGPVRSGQSKQVVSFDVPKGLTRTVLDFPRSSMRVRRSPSEPWKNDSSLDLGTLDSDWREIEAVRYRTPMLIVTASDAAGNVIADSKPAIFYRYRDGQEPRKDRWIDDVRGDVDFEPRQDGGWQSEYLLPDEEFTLTVNADGYQPFEVKQLVPEGQRQEVNAVLRPLVATSDVSAADRQSLVADDEFAGVVTDESGKPLAGVTVDAWTWFPGNETTSDANGRFRLKGLDKHESVELQFTKAGYCPRLFAAEPVGKPNWVVTLNSRTYLEGRVLDPEGQPVAGINLRATRGPIESPDESWIGAVWTETETDPDGHYRIYLEPDTYELRVRRPGVGVVRHEKVVVRENDRRDFDLQLDPGPTFRARIIDSITGGPVGGIRLFRWREPEIVGTSSDDGELTIENMLPGRYEFNVSADRETSSFPEVAGDYARWWSPDTLKEWQRLDPTGSGDGFQRNFDGLEFDIQEGMDPVTIVVERDVMIRGQVIDPDGNPVTEATVAPAKTGSGNSLTGDTRYSVSTGADGKFEMRLPASGASKYNLVAHDGKYEEWRTWANGVGELLATKPGDRLENVTLQLTRPSVVRGRVLDASGKPLADHPVRAHAADKMENRYYDPTTNTNERGEFELKYVRPGKQYIQADPFWLVAEQGPRAAWQLVETNAERPVEDVVLRLGANNRPNGSFDTTFMKLREKGDEIGKVEASSKDDGASGDNETQHTVSAGGTTATFVAGNPATPWDYEPNAVRLVIEDAAGRAVSDVAVTVYRVDQLTGEQAERPQVLSDANGVVDLKNVMVLQEAEEIQRRMEKGQLPSSVRNIFYVVLKHPGMGTVILPTSDFTVAGRGLKRRVRMQPAAELSGRVTDMAGEPLAGAIVAAGALSGTFVREGVNAVVTDDDGRFRLTSLAAFHRKEADKRKADLGKLALQANRDISTIYPAIYDPAEDVSTSDLSVTRTGFAVTTKRGGDVPGTTDIVMERAAAIEGRVVEFGTGKPASRVEVKTVGQRADSEPQGIFVYGDAPLDRLGNRAASTWTDEDGRYRLTDLPAGTYEVWAEAPVDDLAAAAWLCRGVGGLRTKTGAEPTIAPDLTIGPGAVIHGQLLDASSGKPLAVEPSGLTLLAMVMFDGGPYLQFVPTQRVPISADAEFEIRVCPGKSRVFLTVQQEQPFGETTIYGMDQTALQWGQIFDVKHGESIKAIFPVWSQEILERREELSQKSIELMSRRRFDDAIASYSEGIAADPNDHMLYLGRAIAYETTGRWREAIADTERAIVIRSEVSTIKLTLADLLATAPDASVRDGKRAVQLMSEMLDSAQHSKLTSEPGPWALQVLAAAQAETGDFDGAVASQREAIELAPKESRPDMRKRLQLFEARTPYHREPIGELAQP